MPEKYVPPSGAERTLAAALILLAAHDPAAVAALLERTSTSARVHGRDPERVRLFDAAASMLRRGAAPPLWARIRSGLGALGSAWREAVLEADLEEEARELERRAREPESHGERRGRVEVGPLVAFAVLALGVFALAAAGPEDYGLVRWIGLGGLALLGAFAACDLALSRWRARRARAELEASLARPPEFPDVVRVTLLRSGSPPAVLLELSNLEERERVRVALQRRHESVADPLAGVWRDAHAWRVTSSGDFEREVSS